MRLRHFFIILKILVGASLVYLLVRDAAAEDVWSVLARTRFSLIFLAVLIFAAAVTLNAIRWRIVLDLLGTRLTGRAAIVGTFEGMFFNLFLPTGVGGDVVRAYRAYDYGLSARRAAEGALIDRALGLWGLALAVAAAALFSTNLQHVPGWQLLVGFAAVVIVGGLGVAYAAKLFAPNTGAGWIAGALSLVGDYGRVVRAPLFWKAIVPMLALSNLLIGLSAWIVAQGVGLAPGFADMVIVIEGGALTAMIPISIGGWGVREGTIVVLMQAMEYPQAASLATSALTGLILAIIGLAGAAIWIASPYNRSFRPAGRGRHEPAEPDERPDPGAGN